MANEDRIWLQFPRYSEEYIKGVNAFIGNAFDNFRVGVQIRCPCKKCNNRKWHVQNSIYDHLICDGPSPMFIQWIHDVSGFTPNNDENEKNDEIGMDFGDDLNKMVHDTYGILDDQMEATQDGHKKGPNRDAKKFYKLIEEGKQPLYPGCDKFSRLSFTVRLYLFKCLHGVSEAAFSDLLELIREAFPNANIPKSFNDAKSLIKDLGLDYKKIHACPNDCMLFWAENEGENFCKICSVSRWKAVDNEEIGDDQKGPRKTRKVAAKVMRYFPLKPRLQRMFMCKERSELMIWHAIGRKKDGKLRHPADGKAWKEMDSRHPQFSSETRNVRLGLASDGFNLFRTMSISHSTWPIILVNYNLPPWLSMKSENLILSTLIPGPTSPGNDIDVYMQPLIAELKELWDVGLETYDALTDQSFILRASLLWTISDFPAYAMLSGWSTKGKFACPICHYETSSCHLKYSRKMCYMNHRKFLDSTHKWRLDKRRFNGKVEMGEVPTELSGVDIEELLEEYENVFGKKRKKKHNPDVPLKKKSIFFELPYWRYNACRHNLDVMHIEKNICDNVLGTLLGIAGKTKDHLNARLDLQAMGIRKVLHPTYSSDGKHFQIEAANFDMTSKEKEIFCMVMRDAKLPYGCVSNIGRCVQMSERKISGYKSHDAHFILQYLLQFGVKTTLKPEVAYPLIRLGAFFKSLCNKVVDPNDLKKLQSDIVETLCQLEMIFPPSFFDIMVHLPIHLCKEVELGGPVHNRWMFPIERYLGKLKSYVCNRSKPEGSIAEGYLAEECVTFCSWYLGDNVKAKVHNSSAKFGGCSLPNVGYPLGMKTNKNGKAIHLNNETWLKAHRYILFNCGNEEIEALIKQHQNLFESNRKSNRYKRARTQSDEFYKWLKDDIVKNGLVSWEVSSFAKGPNRSAKRFTGYVINGYRFHTKRRDEKCSTQNSGVLVTALTTSFTSSKDRNPKVGDVSYYGTIEDIIEVDYWGAYNVVLFRCYWYQEEKDDFGLLRVNFKKLVYKTDPFVMATHVHQVFFIEDPIEKSSRYVLKKLPREWYEIGEGENAIQVDMDGPTVNENVGISGMEIISNVGGWHREDVPSRQMPIPSNLIDVTPNPVINGNDSSLDDT